jgi:hypothetical protein
MIVKINLIIQFIVFGNGLSKYKLDKECVQLSFSWPTDLIANEELE